MILLFEKNTTQISIINKIGSVTANAILGEVTSISNGIPRATAPPQPDFEIAVMRTEIKPIASNSNGVTTPTASNNSVK